MFRYTDEHFSPGKLYIYFGEFTKEALMKSRAKIIGPKIDCDITANCPCLFLGSFLVVVLESECGPCDQIPCCLVG